MASIRNALALSFAAKYTDLAISTVSVMVLARLLTPAEIGVWSVGAAVAALAHVVRGFGVGNYLVQEKDLTVERIRAALGVAILIAWTMAILLFTLSGVIARFYDEPGLQKVLIVLSATFLVIPLSSPVLALLRRDMAFGALYKIGVADTAVYATTAMTLAAFGFGFMSLAWAALAAALTTALVANFHRPQKAKVLPSLNGWQRVARFGSAFSVIGVVTEFGANAVDLILGRQLGFVSVGLYSRANGLVAIFHRDIMSAIRNVALPAFALEHREDRDLRVPYLRAISFITLFAWPFYGFLGLMAFPVVRILFGSQWDTAVPLVQILSVAVAIGTLWSLVGQMLIATGHVGKVVSSELIIQSSRILLILMAAPFGLEAVAASQILFYIFGMLVYHHHLSRVIGVSYGNVLEMTWPSLAITCWSLIAPLLVLFFMDLSPGSILLPFSLALTGSGFGWAMGLAVSNHPAKSDIRATLTRLIRRYT